MQVKGQKEKKKKRHNKINKTHPIAFNILCIHVPYGVPYVYYCICHFKALDALGEIETSDMLIRGYSTDPSTVPVNIARSSLEQHQRLVFVHPNYLVPTQ